MKKTIFAIALTALVLVASTGYSSSDVGVRKGDVAPQLSLSNDSRSVSLSDLRGKYVVLSFWSAADAPSRVNCNRVDAWTRQHPDRGVAHLSVNLDANEALARQLVQNDSLDASVQFYVQGPDAEKIIKDFRLGDGVNSLLIGPDGRISEINPEVSILASL